MLLGLWAGQNLWLPQTRERDLNRVSLYARFSQLLLEADAASGRSPEETLAKIHRLGLSNAELLPLSEASAVEKRRADLPMGFVEASEVFRGADGQPAGVVRFRRWDDTTRLALDAMRGLVGAFLVGGLLLIGLTWWNVASPAARRLRELAEKVRRDFGADGKEPDKRDKHPIDILAHSIDRAASQTLHTTSLRQRLLDGHTEAATIETTDGTLLEVNAAYCRIFNRTREELVGSNYLDLIPPSDRSDAVNSLRQLSRRQPVNVIDHRVVLPDGTVRWMRWRDEAVFDDADQVVEVLSFGTDITAEKKLETRLAALQLAFDQMQSLARTGSLTWDISADCMEWTDETFRLLGLECDKTEPSLASLLEAVVSEDRGPLRQLFERARENDDPFEHEFRAMLPDGSRRVLQSRAEVRTDPKTKLLDRLTCALRDITTLRDAEAATKRELRLREAIEQSLAAGIVVSDEQGKNLLVNPAFCEMTGWAAEELVGATAPYPYWPEEEIPNIRRAFEAALAGETPAQGYELRFRRKDGSRFDVLVKVAPLLESNDMQLGWLGAVTDISAIQQTRRELQTTNERLRIAQDVAEFGIWDWDPIRDTLHWDRQSFALFGFPDATNPQEVWSKIHSEEEQERLTYELKRLIATGGTSGQDRIRARWPDGTVHDILSTYVILRDETGRGTRVLGINRDVTAEVEEERELRDANERLAAALEGGNFGTFEHVFGLGALNWNAVNYEMHGIDPSITDPEKLFAAWKDVVGDDYPIIERAVAALPVDKTSLTYDFGVRLRATGEQRRIRSSVFVERNRHGHPLRLVGVSRRLD